MKHKRSSERKPTRLPDYDYSQSGGYFVTICTYDKHQFLSRIVNDKVVLTVFGEIVLVQWTGLPDHYAHVELDKFVIMPNHVHGIIFLVDDEQTSAKSETSVGEGLQTLPYEQPRKSKRHGLPEIVRGFKTYSARKINEFRHTKGGPVWQRSFYDRIIRGEDELNRIREYILYNPARWHKDEHYK